ncbi:hypothetical protein KM043_003923 [Ampulex compressa]|nr:hypothetical protein KM043_003923 [Ampulex compressa]
MRYNFVFKRDKRREIYYSVNTDFFPELKFANPVCKLRISQKDFFFDTCTLPYQFTVTRDIDFNVDDPSGRYVTADRLFNEKGKYILLSSVTQSTPYRGGKSKCLWQMQ